MVRLIFSFLLINLLSFGYSFGAAISVSSETDADTLYENQPINVLVTVTHPEDQSVDTKSFLLGKDPIEVDIVKEVRFAPDNPLLLSLYRFQLPGKPKGLYSLPGVSVKVGGTVYRSIASTYSVEKGAVPPSATTSIPTGGTPQPSESSATAPSLTIEAFIDGKTSVYPGERFKAVYKYRYTGEIDLIKESLPLLDGEGFIKIGEKEIVDSTEGAVSIRTISQIFEAKRTGEYSFGPSTVEGYAYIETKGGKKSYIGDKLISTVPKVLINVIPFPDQDKPASFSGAIGQFTFTANLDSSPNINVGDEFTLNLSVGGKGNFNTVSISNLCCQPGFSGFFKLSDLPPIEDVKGDNKSIKLKMRPMTDTVNAIPAVEFSFFNPISNQYVVLRSDPIPIKVKPSKLPPLSETANPSQNEAVSAAGLNEPDPKTTPLPIEIEGIYPLAKRDLMNLPLGNWWALALLPLFILIILYQWAIKNYFNWLRGQPCYHTSKMVFQEAFSSQKSGEPWSFERVKNAFKLALFEAGIIPSESISDDEIPSNGIPGEVKELFAEFDLRRFAKGEKITPDEALKKAKPLFHKLQKMITENNNKDNK